MLEEMRTGLDRTAKVEFHSLLGLAGEDSCSNIMCLHPDFDLEDMLDDLPAP